MKRCAQVNYNFTRSIMKLRGALSLVFIIHLLHGSIHGAVIRSNINNGQEPICTCSHQRSNTLTSELITDKAQPSITQYNQQEQSDFLNAGVEGSGYLDYNGNSNSESSFDEKSAGIKTSIVSGSSDSKEDEMKDVLKQVILIKPPEQIYKHEISIQENRPRKAPQIVIYVLPPKVKHTYNITDHRMHLSFQKSKPMVFYLPMESLEEVQDLEDSQRIEFENYSNEKQNEISANNLYGKLNDTFENSLTTTLKRKEQPKNVKDELIQQSSSSEEQIKNFKYEFNQESNFPEMYQSGPEVDSDVSGGYQDDNLYQPNLTFYPEKVEEKIPQRKDYDSWTEDTSTVEKRVELDHTIDNFDFSKSVGESNFEIFPAILKSYFYIGPENN